MTIPLMRSALADIAEYLQLEEGALQCYADEYPYHHISTGDFPHSGGLSPEESALLYTLVRVLKPRHILEFGTHSGGSTTVMATALRDNGLEAHGQITCIDINPDAGWLIPDDLRPYMDIHVADVETWLREQVAHGVDLRHDFIFEDCAHSEGQVHFIYSVLGGILYPGGIILSHDILDNFAFGVGQWIRNGMAKGGAVGWREYQLSPSSLGISVYQYTGSRSDGDR